MTNTFFVTGTDTDAGKTFACAGLLQAAKSKGLTTLGYKPIAAGCEQTPLGLRNSDAQILQAAASIFVEYDEVNPIALEQPIAPHIAAQLAGKELDEKVLSLGLRQLEQKQPDLLLVEGAGGWRLPLQKGRYLSHWVQDEKLPVILVVGAKLGCLNHALLTAEAIAADGLTLAGWICNRVVIEQAYFQENLQYLTEQIKAPLLGCIPHLQAGEQAGQYLDLAEIIDE